MSPDSRRSSGWVQRPPRDTSKNSSESKSEAHPGAEETLTFHVPPEASLCLPVNLTWTGGIPPYMLDFEPSFNGFPNVTANEREIGIQTTWFVWTPDFPAGSRLEINVVGSGSSPSSGGFMDVLLGLESSCLNAEPTTTTPPSSLLPSANGFATSEVGQATATSSPIIPVSHTGSLGKGALVGITGAACIVGVGFIVLVAWYLFGHRNHIQRPTRGSYRNIVTSASAVPSLAYLSTLLSVDPSALEPLTLPHTSPFDHSSDPLPAHDRDPPHDFVPSKPITRLSPLHAAENKDGIPDISAMNERPRGIAEPMFVAHPEPAVQPSPSLGAILQRSRGLMSRLSDAGSSDVASNMTPPPPYEDPV